MKGSKLLFNAIDAPSDNFRLIRRGNFLAGMWHFADALSNICALTHVIATHIFALTHVCVWGIVIELCHRRMWKLLVVALAAVWLACLACADTAITPAVHQQHKHLPCCPRSSRQGAQCSTIECGDQAFQKTDARCAADAPAIYPVGALRPTISLPSLSSFHELVPGLYFRAAVFRLKDDLRI